MNQVQISYKSKLIISLFLKKINQMGSYISLIRIFLSNCFIKHNNSFIKKVIRELLLHLCLGICIFSIARDSKWLLTDEDIMYLMLLTRQVDRYYELKWLIHFFYGLYIISMFRVTIIIKLR